jgi:hypothetical protein
MSSSLRLPPPRSRGRRAPRRWSARAAASGSLNHRIVGGVEQQHQLPRSRAFLDCGSAAICRPMHPDRDSGDPAQRDRHPHPHLQSGSRARLQVRWSMLDRCRSAHHAAKDRPSRSFGPIKPAHLCPRVPQVPTDSSGVSGLNVRTLAGKSRLRADHRIPARRRARPSWLTRRRRHIGTYDSAGRRHQPSIMSG